MLPRWLPALLCGIAVFPFNDAFIHARAGGPLVTRRRSDGVSEEPSLPLIDDAMLSGVDAWLESDEMQLALAAVDDWEAAGGLWEEAGGPDDAAADEGDDDYDDNDGISLDAKVVRTNTPQ